MSYPFGLPVLSSQSGTLMLVGSARTFHERRCVKLALTSRFAGQPIRFKAGGTLRGLHFQVPPAAQAKLVSVLQVEFSTLHRVRAVRQRSESMCQQSSQPNRDLSSTSRWASHMDSSRWKMMSW